MDAKIIYLIMSLIGCVYTTDDDIDFKPCVDKMTNGCSVPAGIPFPYKDVFLPACERHDVCYTCGKNYNWTRAHCDKAFQANMMSLCKLKEDAKKYAVAYSSFWSKLKAAFQVAGAMVKWLGIKSGSLDHCVNGVDVYYKAVRGFGHGNFHHGNDRSVCNMKCAAVLGDPLNLI